MAFVVPFFAFSAVVFLLPLLMIVGYSFFGEGFTFGHYEEFFPVPFICVSCGPR